MTEVIEISGMSCNGCVVSVQKALARLPIESAQVEIGKAMVEFDETKVQQKDIVEAIEDAGYDVEKVW